MLTGESHYFLGARYRLKVIQSDDHAMVEIRNHSFMELNVAALSTLDDRCEVLERWYRREMKTMMRLILEKWQSRMNLEVTFCGVKKMKTRWGSCNVDARRIWLNLELIKKPIDCLEYVLVHEMLHLFERKHNDRFISLMDKFLPRWRSHRDELNQFPLSHADWKY